MYIHCCNRAELARCVETTVCHNCAQQTGTIDTCQGANAHWAMPHLSGRRSSLLKRVRFGYGSLTNLFSTTLSIQANSRVLTLTVSAKRKPVHSSYRDVTTKSERVIAHVIGSNLLWQRRMQNSHVIITQLREPPAPLVPPSQFFPASEFKGQVLVRKAKGESLGTRLLSDH